MSTSYYTEDRRLMAVQELTKGMTSAMELLGILQDHQAGFPLKLAGATAAKKVEEAFSAALSVLMSGKSHDRAPTDLVTELCFSSVGSQNRESSKASPGGRGCYKRREVETWTTMTASPLDDGHAWRKYGQKRILKTNHPRCYFRCTHRDDQGCEATKTVQRLEGQDSKYLVTYMGQHICKDSYYAPPIILDCTSDDDCMLNFEAGDSISAMITSVNSEYYNVEQNVMLPKLTKFESSEHSLHDLLKGNECDPAQTPSEIIIPTSATPNLDIFDMEDSFDVFGALSQITYEELHESMFSLLES